MTKDIYWLNDDSRKFLKKDYLIDGETAESRIRDIAVRVQEIIQRQYLEASDSIDVENTDFWKFIQGLADKIEDYMHRGFYSLSSPIWANFGRVRGLPISCFGSVVPDTMDGILGKIAETGMMTKHGGGTSAYFGKLRGRGSPISSGGTSTGSVHFMKQFDTLMDVVSQGNVRRGAFAAYLPIDHKDIEEFLQIQDENHPIQNVSIGVTVSDEFMNRLTSKDQSAMKVWASVIKKRFETGYPYIFWSDNVNNQKPDVYKDLDLEIYASNLCTEIMLPSSKDESFVCDLLSINAERHDELKDTDAIEVAAYILEAVMTEFIEKTEGIPYMEAPRRFAIRHRALGIGLLGWHSLLQSKMIAFESMDAKMLNTEIWSMIRNRAYAASAEMAKFFGEPEVLKGYGRRHTTLLAVAPTTSSSFILGQVSPSIEPLNSNYFVKNLAKGNFTYKNPYLIKLLEELGQNTVKIWKSILVKGGSVQHLDFLSEHEKDVFKTFGEISQKEIIIQAAQRQKFIDQGQSLNLMIPPNISVREVNQLLIFAWEQKIKSLYYQRSANPAQELARSILSCSTCEA